MDKLDQSRKTPEENWTLSCEWPQRTGKRHCRWCGAPLPGRRRKWCSQRCVNTYLALEYLRWEYTCWYVKDRDDLTCQDCGFSEDVVRQAVEDAGHQWYQLLKICGWYSIRTLMEVHHIVPRSDGGSNHPDNLVLLCARCHKARTRRWRAERVRPGRDGRGPEVTQNVAPRKQAETARGKALG